MQMMIAVENIKCGGCAQSIKNALLKNPGVNQVEVDVEHGQISVEGEQLSKEALCKTLLSLGYPEKGSTAGLAALKARGKSFVSCAIGRMDKNA